MKQEGLYAAHFGLRRDCGSAQKCSSPIARVRGWASSSTPAWNSACLTPSKQTTMSSNGQGAWSVETSESDDGALLVDVNTLLPAGLPNSPNLPSGGDRRGERVSLHARGCSHCRHPCRVHARVSRGGAPAQITKVGHSNQSMTFIPQLAADEHFAYLDCPVPHLRANNQKNVVCARKSTFF